MSTDMHTLDATLEERIDEAFGEITDDIARVDARAGELLAEHDAITWEADASTFAFSHVSRSAEAVLGYPAERWTGEPTFWADVVVHHADRDEAVSFCVAETGQCRDHAFEYRAKAVDGKVVRLRDYVRVIPDAAGRPARLRGIMIVVPSGRVY
jgi:PAS domain S-box-containing protein